jgi:hypothetical protein
MVQVEVVLEVSAQTTATLQAQVREDLGSSLRLREPLLSMLEVVEEVRQTPTLLLAVLEVEEKAPLMQPMICYRQLAPRTLAAAAEVAEDSAVGKPLVALEGLE